MTDLSKMTRTEIIVRMMECAKALDTNLDGKTVGDLGEVYACETLGLVRNTHGNLKGHDAIDPRTGEKVEIKTTTRKSFGFRSEPQRAVLVHLAEDGEFSIVYDGPGKPIWEVVRKRNGAGQHKINMATVKKLYSTQK